MESRMSILFALLRAGLENKAFPEDLKKELTPEVLYEIYKISKSHDMAHIVGHALSSMGIEMPQELSQKFFKQQMFAVYRYENINNIYEKICNIFEHAEIRYIPLKGSVIRQYYAEPWMRTSCDIDILINECDISRAVELLSSEIGFERNPEKSFHDISVFLCGGVHLELHFNILETMPSMDKVLARVWEYSKAKNENGYCYLQSNEFLMFHLVAHNAYHFINGGCGMRPFADWSILKKCINIDAEVLDDLLTEASLKDFELAMTELSNVWFSGKKHTSLTYEMENYILGAGVYGTLENKVAIASEQSEGRLRYFIYRVFMPRKSLTSIYPNLEKYPILYPFYTVKRWFRILFGKNRKKAFNEIKYTASVSSDKSKRLADMCSALNLKK